MIRRKEYYFQRVICFICLTLLWLPLSEGQIRLSKKRKAGTTRAIVIGISDYQNISDLLYAHRDAQVFGQYLRSKAGGQLTDKQLHVLTDSTATLAAIKDAMEWIVAQSQSGDRAIIYFAGHGDVEQQDSVTRGYLLAHDSPFNNYHLNAISVKDMDETLGTLTSNGVEVLFISDACRSGSLAGEKIDGNQITAKEMIKFKDNSILIMSCKSDQLSEEGLRWGNGRGAFSFHLVNGLVGMADKLPKDKKLKLLELELHLKREVPLQTENQLPIIEGDRLKLLNKVDVGMLEFIIEAQDSSSSLLSYDIKSVAERETETDSISLRYEAQMLDALNKGALLSPKADCANYYFQLLKERNFARLDELKSKLTIALQDDAQQALNAYLNSDPEELNSRWRYHEKYSRFPQYLETAAAILGDYDKYYPELMAKKFYFDGLILRLQGEKESNKATANQLYRLGITMQKQALAQDNLSAFIYNELGLLHKRLKEYDEAIPYFEKAIERSPSWVMAYNNLATIFYAKKDYDTAEAYSLVAIELDSTLGYPYRTLGQVYYRKKDYEKAEESYLNAIKLNPDYAPNYFNLALNYKRRKNLKKTEECYLKAIELNPKYLKALNNLSLLYISQEEYKEAEEMAKRSISVDPSYYQGYLTLSSTYTNRKSYKESESVLKKAISIAPKNPRAYNWLGEIYLLDKDFDNAEETYKKGLEISNKADFYFNLAIVYLEKENYSSSEQYFEEYIQAEGKDPDGYFMMACALALNGKKEEVTNWLEKAQEKGFEYWEGLLSDKIRKRIKSLDLDALEPYIQ